MHLFVDRQRKLRAELRHQRRLQPAGELVLSAVNFGAPTFTRFWCSSSDSGALGMISWQSVSICIV